MAVKESTSAEIINSYDNTEELKKAFPIVNPTPVETELEKKIQNRLLTGFENWNRGTAAWMAWGNILYNPESMYNIRGVRFTLEEYQLTSNLAMKKSYLEMGNFNNMLICGDWAAIHYRMINTDVKTKEKTADDRMQFLHFVKAGNGVKVCECFNS